MRKYYKKNQNKLKEYSSEYKKEKRGKTKTIPVEIKSGMFLVTFN